MKIKTHLKFVLFIFLVSTFFVSTLFAQNVRPNFNRVRTFDVQHYVIRVSFDRSAKQVFGDTTVQLKPLANNFRQFELDSAEMVYDSVKLDADGKDLSFQQAGQKIIVTLDRAYSPNDLISIRFKYSVKPSKGVYFVNEQKTRGEVARSAQIWTQGEPEYAHYWFPSYDFPDDKATTEEFITVEKDETAIGNGELLETVENMNGTKTFHYKMPVKHSVYLVSFVVGKYKRIEDKFKNITLGVYLYEGKEQLAKTAFGNTKEMMRIYEELTGVGFAYNKYDQTIVGNYDEFAAMENITATTLSDKEVFFADFDFGKNGVEDIVAHELAHSWFGNLVTCRNWAELWLNEGFATFMEAAYREKMYGRAQYLEKIREDVETYRSERRPRRQQHGLFNTLARPDDSIFDTTTYQKGGAVIHTLRETIGDKAFWEAINIYLNRHKFENVETSDLQKAMEEASGQKLDWFFAQWVYGGGTPQVEVKQEFNAQNKTLTLRIKQTQEADDLIAAVFTLPLDVEIQTTAKTFTQKIRLDKREQVFTFKLNGKPSSVKIDKDYKIPLMQLRMQSVGGGTTGGDDR
ncbi:hypothetical protein BH10ACI1_BH10ACI1_28680 [soil metagenome]